MNEAAKNAWWMCGVRRNIEVEIERFLMGSKFNGKCGELGRERGSSRGGRSTDLIGECNVEIKENCRSAEGFKFPFEVTEGVHILL